MSNKFCPVISGIDGWGKLRKEDCLKGECLAYIGRDHGKEPFCNLLQVYLPTPQQDGEQG